MARKKNPPGVRTAGQVKRKPQYSESSQSRLRGNRELARVLDSGVDSLSTPASPNEISAYAGRSANASGGDRSEKNWKPGIGKIPGGSVRRNPVRSMLGMARKGPRGGY